MRVLVVDDEKLIQEILRKVIALQGIDVRTASGGQEAVAMAQKEKFDLVLVDMKMPGMNGPETMRALKGVDPEIKFIVMTGYAVDDLLEDARKEGALLSLQKPFDIQTVAAFVKDFKNGLGNNKSQG